MDVSPELLRLNISRLGLWTTAIPIAIALLTWAARALATEQDPQEPPLIKPCIPIVGHLFGIYKYGTQYYELINRQHKYPIYTLGTPGMKQYVVTSPTIAAQLQRSHKDLTFYGAITPVTKRLTGLSAEIMDKAKYNMDGHEGRDKGLMPVMHDMLANVLGRGQTLHDLTTIQLAEFSRILNSIDTDGKDHEVSLLAFLQEAFTIANIRTIYGPDNPISHDSSVLKAFWDFEKGLVGLIVDIVPSLTARTAHLGREHVVSSLIAYLHRGAHHNASPVIQNRVRINLANGNSLEEAGRSELVVWFAILGNAVPSAFWVIMDIFTRPQLLAEVRGELLKAVSSNDEDGSKKTINISMIKSSCPLFVSCYRETLRLIGNLASIRYVWRDTNIGKIFLKGGSMIQMAGAVIHQDPAVWGEDAREFDPKRFMKTSASVSDANREEQLPEVESLEETTATALPPGVPSAAYRLFGGGSVVCPGRHFAQSEILGFVAFLILAFDLTDLEGKTLVAPERDTEGIPLTVLKPKSDVKVRMKRREGLEGVTWEMVV